jgi:hypothetical protein
MDKDHVQDEIRQAKMTTKLGGNKRRCKDENTTQDRHGYALCPSCSVSNNYFMICGHVG